MAWEYSRVERFERKGRRGVPINQTETCIHTHTYVERTHRREPNITQQRKNDCNKLRDEEKEEAKGGGGGGGVDFLNGDGGGGSSGV